MPDIAHQRLYHQRIAHRTFDSPAAVVEWLGAVQAQEYPASLWAIGLRLPNATDEVIEQAIADRTIVRTWPMRGTIHFVPARDAKWMLQYFTPKVISRVQSMYRRAGLDEATFARARDLTERALEGGKSLTRPALYQVLQAGGVATGSMRGGFITGRLASDGLICFGPRQGKQPTIVLLDEWVPDSRMLDRDAAVAELARRYFTSHGPATLHDFGWWSGATIAETKAALGTLKSTLIEATIDGKTYWMSSETPAPPQPSPTVYLLPAFDEYLVSYKDRSASVDLQNPVVGLPENHLGWIIVIDGQVVGLWKRTIKKDAVVIESTLTRTLTSAERAAFEAAAQHYGSFLRLPVVFA